MVGGDLDRQVKTSKIDLNYSDAPGGGLDKEQLNGSV